VIIRVLISFLWDKSVRKETYFDPSHTYTKINGFFLAFHANVNNPFICS